MAADEKWYFTKEQLATTPSRKCGFDADKELSYRQQAANFIQDMGQRLSVSQLCINTAIVYMHRFYVFHSLTSFHRNAIASAALFLAAKVEEQPRKLEHVIKVAHLCLHREQPALDTKSELYLDQAQDLVFNENVLLQTLGFDVAIDHPHTHVVRCCHLVKASKDLAQTSYFMASNSLHLTTMCLQYKPTVVACFCIHLACKWSNWEIPQSNEGKHWFWYVDRTVTSELLQQLTAEFLHIFDRCPSRLKRKIMSISANQSPNMSHPSLPSSPFDMEPRKIQSPVNALDGGPVFQSNRPHHDDKKAASASGRPPVDYREYREKKERERLDREKAAAAGQGHAHHHKPVPTGAQLPGKHPVPPPGQKPHVHHNHHHNRPEMKPGAQISVPQLGPAPSRHSFDSQRRESANRQRVPREYNSSSGTSGGTVFTHGHGPPAGDGSSSGVPMPDGRSEQNLSAETSQEKQGNNNSHAAHHSVDSKHLQPPTSSENKRQYDPARHKPPEHRKEDSQKLYGKYTTSETARIERQRKQPDILEQRSEEVRKLIEKPIMLPLVAQKPRQEIQKEEYAASMAKQSHHHAKYGQEKLQGNPVVVLNQMKPPFGTREKSPANANATQQMMAKANKPMQAGPYSHHAAAQVSKDGVRNGNTAPVTTPTTVNLEDIKTEKKPKLEEPERTAPPYSATPPGAKHRSLFSPEKTIAAPRESSHPQRAKLKQKMDSALRSVKQEPIGVKLPTELMSHFTSPTTAVSHTQMEHTQSFKRSVNETATSSSHKRHRASSICEPEQTPKIKEEPGGMEAMKMIGRVPDLIQPIRDNPTSSNGKNSSVANDLKPPELIKPFEPEPLGVAPVPAQGLIQQPLSNGYDLSRINPAQESQDGRYAQPTVGEHPEYLSPLKSARGISALLQENTIPPLPSILQQQQQQQQLGQGDNPVDRIGEAPVGASATVQTSTLTTTTTVTTVTEEKRSEHHKSEKKKKKDKHKHKDKDKGKEERKHKHKHKDREKDRHHRDKESRGGGGDDGSTIPNSGGGTAAAIPIKITIPKDKINLGAGGDATSTHTPSEGSSLKIKIPKERLKGGDNPSEAQIHAPLKMKIRTGAGIGNNMEARKREREADGSPTILGGGPPPLKKHSQPPAAGGTTGNYSHRTSVTGERQQNGRHYPGGSAGNNKEKHSSSSSSYYKTSSKSSSQHSSHPT